MILDYDSERSFQKSLEIDDFGNCCIRGTSEKTGFDHYISIQTIMGTSYIFKIGPVCPDLESLDPILDDNEFHIYFRKVKYNEKKLKLELNGFINDFKRQITIAEVTSLNEVLAAIPKVSEFNKLEKKESGEEDEIINVDDGVF